LENTERECAGLSRKRGKKKKKEVFLKSGCTGTPRGEWKGRLSSAKRGDSLCPSSYLSGGGEIESLPTWRKKSGGEEQMNGIPYATSSMEKRKTFSGGSALN